MRTLRTGALCSLSLAVSMAVAVPAWAQQKVGVATTVVGPVTVARTSMPPEPLKFKDDIFLRDRVTTGDDAMTRILLGGKVIVTARERSTLRITEVPGLSTIDLTSGRIAVAVDRTRMKPGERVDIRTPNAIAGVRGTVLIVEAEGGTSTVTVLKGLVDVVRIDPKTGHAVGPVTPVGRLQTVRVRNNVLPSRPQAITPNRADALSKEFSPPVRPVAAATVMPVQEEVHRATALLNALVPAPKPATDRQAATASGSITAEAGGSPTLSTSPTVGSTAPTLSSPSAPSTTATAPSTTATAPVTTTLAPVTTTLAPVTTVVAPVVAPVTTTLAPVTTTLAPTPPPPTSSGGLLGGLLKPVTGLLK